MPPMRDREALPTTATMHLSPTDKCSEKSNKRRINLAHRKDTKQREEIVRALSGSKGRVGGADGAAARMGMNRTTLYSRMKKLGIHPKQYV
jgi:formate hydrogenlyase transcriptional activator